MNKCGRRFPGLLRVCCGSVLVCGLTTPWVAQAVINATTQTNTSPPASGSPWTHVGYVNGASGVYVGAGWALTVNHVGPGNFHLNGATIPYTGTSVRLTNANGTSTDLIMFRLASTPNLSRLPLHTNAPAVGSQMDMIGFGRIAATPQTNIGAFTGFYWTPIGYKSWGNNKVYQGNITQDLGQGPLTFFSTLFDASGPNRTSGEAQGAQGDSGGGVFIYKNSVWQLAGIMDTITGLQNQPPDTAVYGQATYIADVNTYRTQINAIIGATIPSLLISRSGTNVQVSWPDTGVNWLLQRTPTVSPTSWGNITVARSTNNGYIYALVPATNNVRFFRLQKQ